jgi:GcvH upstream region-like protein
MLDFLRKYQRFFFIVIAVVIGISFSFFGTQQVFSPSKEVKDYPIGKAVDGSDMRRKEIDEIGRFILTDRMDVQLIEKRRMPNFFNDGVIRKDFLSSGLGVMLADRYFDTLAPSFQEKVAHHRAFRPYEHPSTPLISVEMLWKQVLPMQKVHLDRFLHEDLPTDSHLFSLLVDLYLGETAFPPNVLREYLMFQQGHYNWVQADPALPSTNLNLFYCSSAEDWFGEKFIELVSQFIHNGAIIAKKKGYQVSKEEARVDLFQSGYEALQTQKRTDTISQDELSQLWKDQLLHLGMSEKEAILVWQKVMLMRRLFEDYGSAPFLDSHQYQAFHSYASKTALVDLYQLPPSLHLSSFRDLLNLLYYSKAVSSAPNKDLVLPLTYLPPEVVEQKHPELVQKRFLVEMAEVKKEDLAQDVSLKDMWQWQLDPNHFQLLQENFPQLALSHPTDAEGYFIAIEQLPQDVHQKMDHFSRLKIVDLHPEWIRSALDEKHLIKKEISFSSNGDPLCFDGIQEGKKLLTLFETAALKGEITEDTERLTSRSCIECYSEDEMTYYRFHLLDRDEEIHLLTFAKAKEAALLDKLTENHLEKVYPILRKENPSQFQDVSGAWKPLEEVKHTVAYLAYKEMLDTFESAYTKLGKELPQDRFETPEQFYPSHYLYPYIQTVQNDLRARDDQKSPYLLKTEIANKADRLSSLPPLEQQWNLSLETTTYKNYEKSPWFDESLFSMVEKGWSPIQATVDGKLHFFQLQEKQQPEETYLDQIKKGRQILSVEAERFLMIELLDELEKTGSIHL